VTSTGIPEIRVLLCSVSKHMMSELQHVVSLIKKAALFKVVADNGCACGVSAVCSVLVLIFPSVNSGIQVAVNQKQETCKS